MEFEYTGCFYMSEGAFKELCDSVRAGEDVEYALEDWIAGLDDCDYYEAFYVKDQIIGAIKKAVSKN